MKAGASWSTTKPELEDERCTRSIKTGGKQQKVKAGDVIEDREESIARRRDDHVPPILVPWTTTGKTHVGAEAAKAVVTAKPLGEKKGDKVEDVQVPAEERVREARRSRRPSSRDARTMKFGAAPKRATKAKAEPSRHTPADAPDEAAEAVDPAE